MRSRTLTVLAAGLLGAGAVGCGSESALLAQDDAAGLKEKLEQVRSAVDARRCDEATTELRALRSQAVGLPGTVDRELRMRLREEIDGKLAPQVRDECNDPKTERVPTTTTPAPTGPTGPVEPEPAPVPEPEPEPAPAPESVPEPPAVPEETPSVPAPTPEEPTPDPGGFGEEAG